MTATPAPRRDEIRARLAAAAEGVRSGKRLVHNAYRPGNASTDDLIWCLEQLDQAEEALADQRDNDEYLHACNKLLKDAGHHVCQGAIDGITSLINERDELSAKYERVCGYVGDGVGKLDTLLAKLAASEASVKRMREALEKIADPRKRDHQEPDAYTTLGCVMNIAQSALAEPSTDEHDRDAHGGKALSQTGYVDACARCREIVPIASDVPGPPGETI